ncbi:MAG: hypothetical protein U0T79_09435 [Ferruginibacter sp.]
MTEENSLKIVVEVLKDQKNIPIGDLMLSYENDTIVVTGWTKCFYLETVTKENALHDISLTKEYFTALLRKSSELSDFVKGKKVEYSLAFDYGKGGIGICDEIDGEIKWLHKIT